MTFSIFDIFLVMPPFSDDATAGVKVITLTWNAPSGLDLNWASPTQATVTFTSPATIGLTYDET